MWSKTYLSVPVHVHNTVDEINPTFFSHSTAEYHGIPNTLTHHIPSSTFSSSIQQQHTNWIAQFYHELRDENQT